MHACNENTKREPGIPPPSLQLIVIADDLTGALDTAGQFAAMGVEAGLVLQAGWVAGTRVVAFTTESREAVPATAEARVRALAREHRGLTLYKKIDSTLRGNVAVELIAALEESGSQWAIIAPAFPAQGRVTIDGSQLVHGEPVMAVKDKGCSIYPVPSSNIPTLLRTHTTLPVRCFGVEWAEGEAAALYSEIRKAGEPLLVFDALTQQHLTVIAQAVALLQTDVLLCGSAGLASAVAQVWSGATTSTEVEIPQTRSLAISPPVLFVAGSRNPTTRDQVDRLITSGYDVDLVLARPRSLLHGNRAQLVMDVQDKLHSGRHVVLRIPSEPFLSGSEPDLARAVGLAVREVLAQVRPGTMLLTGGEIAGAVCSSLKARGLSLLGELLPGIPVSKIEDGVASGLTVASKAGGLGSPDALVQMLSIGQKEDADRRLL